MRFLLLGVITCLPLTGNAATVSFQENTGQSYVDIFYTPNPGAEFTYWDLIVRPITGRVLDPNPHQRFVRTDAFGPPAPVDTFANTVYAAVDAGPASYFFNEYNPGSPSPPAPSDPVPTAGATPPNPDELNWRIFDTFSGDPAVPGFTPYHMARIVYSNGSSGAIAARFFDWQSPEGEVFLSGWAFGEFPSDPFVPEPSTLILAVGAVALVAASRRVRLGSSFAKVER